MTSVYARMVEILRRKTEAPMAAAEWVVYILECKDGTFYTGITNDLERRFKSHQNGKGARFTRVRRPLRLVYREAVTSRARALVREYEIKRMSRRRKEKLVFAEAAS